MYWSQHARLYKEQKCVTKQSEDFNDPAFFLEVVTQGALSFANAIGNLSITAYAQS